MDEKIVPVLDIRFNDPTSLQQAYMPFIKGGAIFVPTTKELKTGTDRQLGLGDELILNVRLPEELDTISVAGQVVWITPFGAQGGKKAGIGVHFMGDLADKLRKKIETLIASLPPGKSETM